MGVDWQKLLLAAGGTAAVGLALYYLLREESEESARSFAAPQGDLNECIDILTEMSHVQEYNKRVADKLAADLVKTPLSFVELMKKVEEEMKPDDVLQKRGLDMGHVEKMLEKHQDDSKVRMLVMKFMGANFTMPSEKAKGVSVQAIKQVHKLMVEELEKFFKEFNARPDHKKYDQQRVLVASQVVLSSKVLETFGMTAADVEGAIHNKQNELQTDQEFLNLTQQMQDLLQASMPPQAP